MSASGAEMEWINRVVAFVLGVLTGASVPIFMVHYKDIWSRHREGQDAARIFLSDLESVRKGFESVVVRIRSKSGNLKEKGPSHFAASVTWLSEGLDSLGPHMENRFLLRDAMLEKNLEEQNRKWIAFRDDLDREVVSHKKYLEQNRGYRGPPWPTVGYELWLQSIEGHHLPIIDGIRVSLQLRTRSLVWQLIHKLRS